MSGLLNLTHMLMAVLSFFKLGSVETNYNANRPVHIYNKYDTDKMVETLKERGSGYGNDWIVLPDGKNTPTVAFLNKHSSCTNELSNYCQSNIPKMTTDNRRGYQNVRYHLYTRKNPKKAELLSINSIKKGTKTNFDPQKQTKIYVHGWKSSADSAGARKIRDAYLHSKDLNYIAMDWSYISSDDFYYASVQEVDNVGILLGNAINFLVSKYGAKFSDFHIIGHSLGAHLGGKAGTSTKEKIARITGLDPALPGFDETGSADSRLDPTDANFVDVIHTCAGVLGMSITLGHADFYPNGGTPFQPGCCCLPEVTGSCSHSRSHQYFAESIGSSTPFIATECSSWEDFKASLCQRRQATMGDNIEVGTEGVFYLLTNSESPYAKGLKGATYAE